MTFYRNIAGTTPPAAAGQWPSAPVLGGRTYLRDGGVRRPIGEKLGERMSVDDFEGGGLDDTVRITNAITRALEDNATLVFSARRYVTGPQTVGETGSYKSCRMEGDARYAQYGDTAVANGKGTIIQLAANSNGHLFTVPPADASDVGPGPPEFSNMWLDGNRTAQVGNYCLVDMPSHTATSNKCRSAFFTNIRGGNSAIGIRTGTNRNAGRMAGCAILGTTDAALRLGSCSDWRIIDCDLWSTANVCYHGTGGDSAIFTATNFFSSGITHGVKLDSPSGMHVFQGCSFDRNARSGIYIQGDADSVVLTACRFGLNSASAHNTYSDIVVDGSTRVSIIGCFFDTGGGGTVRPKYCVELLNSASDVILVGSKINDKGSGINPYATAFTNDLQNTVQIGDALTARNFRVDVDTSAVNRVRVKGAPAFNPVIVGCEGDGNAGLNVFAQTTGNLVIGRSTNKLGFYDVATPRSQQTLTGSWGGNAAGKNLATLLANLGLIVDSSTL